MLCHRVRSPLPRVHQGRAVVPLGRVTDLLASSMLRAAVFWAGLFAAVAALTACDGVKAPPAARQAPQVTVLTLKPQNVVLKTLLPGRTAPTVIAEVRPQVTGIIQSRTFTEGAEVKAGSVLYRLDPSTYQAAYDSARASIAKAEAAVQTAQRNVERNKELVAIKFVSQQAYDDAVTTLAQNEADLAAAKAATQAARINLAYTNVVAPIAGRIGKSAVTAGALVTANQPTPLATIQQMNPMYVDITQSSTEALRLRRAMASGELKRAREDAARVTLQLEDGTNYPLEGTLQFSDVTVDASTGAITLRALFPNPDGLLLPNMYVRTALEEGRARERDPRAAAGGDAGSQGPGGRDGGRRGRQCRGAPVEGHPHDRQRLAGRFRSARG